MREPKILLTSTNNCSISSFTETTSLCLNLNEGRNVEYCSVVHVVSCIENQDVHVVYKSDVSKSGVIEMCSFLLTSFLQDAFSVHFRP